MFTINHLQTILKYLAEKLHTTDDGLVQKYIKTNYPRLNKFYYADHNEDVEQLYFVYKGDHHINLHHLTQDMFDSLLVDKFLEQILGDAKILIEDARDEQVKPYLIRIDNL